MRADVTAMLEAAEVRGGSERQCVVGMQRWSHDVVNLYVL
jgi:hypothetical protein